MLAARALAPDQSVLSGRDIVAFADDHQLDDRVRWRSLQAAIQLLRPLAVRHRVPMVTALTCVSEAVWDLSGDEDWEYVLSKWDGQDSREGECSLCHGKGKFGSAVEQDCPNCFGVGLVRR